jgi:hypothetical protein
LRSVAAPTMKSFRVVLACARCGGKAESGLQCRAEPFTFSLMVRRLSLFPRDVLPPNLLPNFSWLIGNHIITTDYVYRSYSIFAMPHLVRRGLCPPRQLLYVPLLQNHCFCWHTSAHTCSNTQPCLKSRACRALPVEPRLQSCACRAVPVGPCL